MKGSVRHCFRVPTTEELIQDLTPAQLRSLAVTMAEIVAPYGVVASDIIDPALFQELSERLLRLVPDQRIQTSSRLTSMRSSNGSWTTSRQMPGGS
jgi:hypothetical protein